MNILSPHQQPFNSVEPLPPDLDDVLAEAVRRSPWVGLNGEPFVPETDAEQFFCDLLRGRRGQS